MLFFPQLDPYMSTPQAMSYLLFILVSSIFWEEQIQVCQVSQHFVSQLFRTIRFQEIGREGFAPPLFKIQDPPDGAALSCQIVGHSRSQCYSEHYLHSAALGYENAPLLPSHQSPGQQHHTTLLSQHKSHSKSPARGLLCFICKGLRSTTQLDHSAKPGFCSCTHQGLPY